jgi:hypothetical protein
MYYNDWGGPRPEAAFVLVFLFMGVIATLAVILSYPLEWICNVLHSVGLI